MLSISPHSIKVKLTNFNLNDSDELAIASIPSKLSLLDKADTAFQIANFLRRFTDCRSITLSFSKAPPIKKPYQWTPIDDYILKTLIQKFPCPSQSNEIKEGPAFVIGEFFKWQQRVQTFCKGFYSENGANIGKLSLMPYFFEKYLKRCLKIEEHEAAPYSKQINMEVLHTYLNNPFEENDYIGFVFNQFMAYKLIPKTLKSQYREAIEI